MIANRAAGLTRFIMALRKGNLTKAVRELGVHNSREYAKKRGRWERILRDGVSDVTGVALELKFGWVPLIQDIYNLTDTLQKPLKGNYERCRGSGSGTRSFEETYSPGFPYGSGENRCVMNYRVGLTAHVYSVNPNLLLANNLGLINPVSVAWQVVPLSFVVDWFLPVNRFLSSFTDLVGSNLVDCSISYKADGSSDQSLFSGWGNIVKHETVRSFRRVGVSSFSVPSFRSQMHAPNLNIGKAITALQLLGQAWAGGRIK
jgi:hypothetical protein